MQPKPRSVKQEHLNLTEPTTDYQAVTYGFLRRYVATCVKTQQVKGTLELRKSETHLQWRRAGIDEQWYNWVALTELGGTGNPGGSVVVPTRVFHEVPAGELDGQNATFFSLFAFVPETVEVFVNGQLQRPIVDYTTYGRQQITLMASPESSESITINYTKYGNPNS